MNNGTLFDFDIDQMIVTLPILILLSLSAVLLIRRANKPKEKRKKLIFSLLPGILAVGIFVYFAIEFYILWTSGGFGGKVYKDDILIDLPYSEEKIVIKEWGDLRNTGADIYFLENGKEQFLGEIDTVGYPFAKGKYEVLKIDSEYFTIRWVTWPEATIAEWSEKTFEIPNDDLQ